METCTGTAEVAVVAEVIARVARRARLSADDALDFGQTVQLRLIESDYAALRQFDARSSLTTYLTVVVSRMLLDWRRTMHGKWRPSRWAVRHGQTAVTLERLMRRDGLSASEAIQVMRCAPDAAPEIELQALADRLPVRLTRRMVAEQCSREVSTFVDPLEQEEHVQRSRQMTRALAAALRRLPREDRRLIDMRFRQRRTVSSLANDLGVDAKALYRQCDRALRVLRGSLEADGMVPGHGAS